MKNQDVYEFTVRLGLTDLVLVGMPGEDLMMFDGESIPGVIAVTDIEDRDEFVLYTVAVKSANVIQVSIPDGGFGNTWAQAFRCCDLRCGKAVTWVEKQALFEVALQKVLKQEVIEIMDRNRAVYDTLK